MADSPTSSDPQTVARLEGLELKARRIVEGYLSGRHRSPHRGFSTEFAEHREYAPGDDLRYLDWKAYGRRDRFYLKQHEEETNFACYLVVDISESMRYQSDAAPLSKLDAARSLAAALAYLIVRQHDAVGLVTFATGADQFLPAAGHPPHVRQVISVLEQAEASGESRIGGALHEVAERIKRRSLVVLISDLFDDADAILLGLRHLHSRRHDVCVLQMIDPAEREFPFRGVTRFQGLEGLSAISVDASSVRRAYNKELTEFLNGIRRGCRDLSIDHELILTDQPLDFALARFLKRRLERTGP